MRKRKDSLTKVIFLSWLTTIIALSIIFIIFSIYYKYNDFEGTTVSLSKAHLESYNRSLKSNVENNLQFLDYISSEVATKPIDENSDIELIREKVVDKINKAPSMPFDKTTTFLLSPEKEILYHNSNKDLIGTKIEFLDEKGKVISDSVMFMARNPKGKSVSYLRTIPGSQYKEKMLCFVKKHHILGVVACSEIPRSKLDSAIAMNLRRLKINVYLEMGFAGLIFIVIITFTVLYIYRLSKSIRAELINILVFINNTNDKKIYNSFAPEKFKFREFEKIGQCTLLLVKQVNKLLKRLSTEAIEAETASQSKSSLFAGFTHDFLVELNTIMGMSQFLLKSDLPNETKDKLNKIFHSSSHIASMLRNLETTALFDDSQSHFKDENINIKLIFGEAIQFVEHEANSKEIEFNYNIDDTIPEKCIGDAVQIRQLIINILRNVISFNEKGSVDLRLELNEETQKLLFEAKNNGEGFLGTELNEIQSFPNARPKYSMLSLRVAVCNYIASELDAKFKLTSVKGEGTCYSLALPLQLQDINQDKVGKVSDEEIQALSDDNSQKNILIVEDEPANRELLEDILQASGYQTLTAENGQIAVDIVEKEDVNLILMDCQMPVLNGFKATKEIRKTEKGKDIGIIAISGCTTPADKKDCFDAGMDDFVPKPFDFDELLEKIKKYIK